MIYFTQIVEKKQEGEGLLSIVSYLRQVNVLSPIFSELQAQAVLSARKVIVDGAVGLVKTAIHQLAKQEIVELDEEKKAKMVNNLMVAIVSEKEKQPIINTGNIY